MIEGLITILMMAASMVGGNTYMADGFYYGPVNPVVQEIIVGVSYPKNAKVSLDDLCYVSILHHDFEGNIKHGELIVHKKLGKEVCEIFYELYRAEYPLASVKLVDEYGGDDEKSMSANNTSAFNYRTVEGSSKLSLHSRGMAVDINPQLNPCVRGNQVSPANGKIYADRSRDFTGKIDKNDLAYRLFIKAGWKWGGSWNSLKDYQHFEKEL